MKSEFDGTGKIFISKFKSAGAKSISGKLSEKPKRFQSKIQYYFIKLWLINIFQY